MAGSIEEIWRRCSEIEDRLRWRGHSIPGVLNFGGARPVTAADYAGPARKEVVAHVLQQLLAAAQEALDFAAQVEILDLMQDLESLT
jgi:hypothetical protein